MLSDHKDTLKVGDTGETLTMPSTTAVFLDSSEINFRTIQSQFHLVAEML